MSTTSFQEREPIAAYAAKSKDVGVLMKSSSGGVFTEMSKATLSQGGVVFGAGWDEEFNVVHKCIDNQDGLEELRGSKYVRSDMNDAVKHVKELLQEQRKVLFAGTPCQCAAVRKLCGDDRNLLLCGVMCHSTANPKVWRKYLDEVTGGRKGAIESVCFRDKTSGWQQSTFKLKFKNGNGIEESLSDNLYAQIYFSGLATQESCFNCRFRKGAHGADLLIGDFWGVDKTHPELFDRNGVSAVLVYTEHGKEAVEQAELSLAEVPYGDVLAYNPYLEKSIECEVGKRMRFEKVWRRVSLRRAYAYAIGGPWYCRVVRFSYRKARTAAGRILRALGLRK